MPYTPLTKEQFQSARQAGFSPDQIIQNEQRRKTEMETTQPKDGFLKTLIQDPLKTLIVKPGVRLGQAIGQGALELGALTGNEKLKAARDRGREIIGKDVRFPGTGGMNIEGQKAFGEGGAKQIAGEGLKTASYLYGAGEAAPLKNTLGGLIKQGTRIGAVGGGAYGAGESMTQDNVGVGGVIASGLIGAGLGAAGGVVFPLAGYGASKIYSGAKYAFTPKAQKVSQAINELEDTYRDINRGWVQTRKASAKAERVTELKNASGTTGRTPERVLAESGIIPEHEGTQFKTRAQADKLRASTKTLREANRNALREAQLSTTPVNIDDFEREAITRARSPKNIANGTADAMENGIRKAMAGYRKNYGKSIPLQTLDDIKSGRWEQTGFSLTKEDRLAGDVDYIIGKTAQDTIENTAAKAGATDVAQLNREIGDLLEAAKFLDNLDGKAVAYGKMGTHMLRLAGAIAGSKGGPLGSLAGAMGGDVLADILRSTRIAGPVKRLLLRDLERTNPAAYTKTLQWLKEQGLEREVRALLPEPSFIPARPKTPTPSGIEITPAAKGPVGFDPKTGRYKATFTSQPQGNLPSLKNEYKAQTIKAVASPSNINKNVSPKSNLGKAKSGQAMYGAFAGFETDDDGNVKFNPEKAAIGIGLTTGLGKINNKAEAMKVFQGFTDITTKVLDKLKGRSSVSKQFISDLTNSPDVRQAERELIRKTLSEMPDNVPIDEFANKVKTELLPLKKSPESLTKFHNFKSDRYESITLPKDIRGNVANYSERIYESPISTSAGSVHFSDITAPNYFAHTRIEDLAKTSGETPYKTLGQSVDISGGRPRVIPLEKRAARGGNFQGDTRRVIEIQSDLFQKGRLDEISRAAVDDAVYELSNKKWNPEAIPDILRRYELDSSAVPEIERVLEFKSSADIGQQGKNSIKQMIDEASKIPSTRTAKLEPYRNTWHERIIREEVKSAAADGKSKLQFPTGETAMKIEGLDRRVDSWGVVEDDDIVDFLSPNKMKVGVEVTPNPETATPEIEGQNFIISEVLGDGKFKAIPSDRLYTYQSYFEKEASPKQLIEELKRQGRYDEFTETFDLSGKVDTENPIYKFYEKDVAKFLKNQYGAHLITDPQGVKWMEVNITPELKDKPINAFGKTTVGTLAAGSAIGAATVFGQRGSTQTYTRPEPQKYQPNPEVKKIAEAIANNETGTTTISNPYTYRKPSGNPDLGDDLGKYQVTEGELETYAKRFLGRTVSAAQFISSPELQDEYIHKKIQWLMDNYGWKIDEILAAHRGGMSKPDEIERIKKERKGYIESGKKHISKTNFGNI